MAEGDIETFYEDGRWWNRVVGGGVFNQMYPTKEQAAIAGCTLARERRVAHIVRDAPKT